LGCGGGYRSRSTTIKPQWQKVEKESSFEKSSGPLK